MNKTLSLLIIIIIYCGGFINAENNFCVEFSSGYEICEWKTKLDDGIRSGIALNHSDFQSSIPVKVSVHYNLQKIAFGIETKNQYAFISELQPSIDPGSLENVSNSDGVNFFTIFAIVKYQLIGKKSYKMTPSFGFGTFVENSTHTAKDDFASRYAIKIGVSNEIHKEKYYLHLSPTIQTNRFKEREIIDHNVLSLGIEMGIGFKIGKK